TRPPRFMACEGAAWGFRFTLGEASAGSGEEGDEGLSGVLDLGLFAIFFPARMLSTSGPSSTSLSRRASAMVLRNFLFFFRISVAFLWHSSTMRFTSASII